MLNCILLGLAAFTGWVLFLLASPVGRCRRCRGERIIRTRLRGRVRKCPRCRGAGRSSRTGAVWVHRARWAIRRAVAGELERRREKVPR